MNQVTSVICRVFFVGAFVLAGLAIWEKIANVAGYTVLRTSFNPWRLLEFAAIALLFVIALLLREIKHGVGPKGTS
jgi:hypothetical protein